MDRELLDRARAGEMEAFDQIVLAKGEPLFRTAFAILGNEADARDAVQETLVNAWRKLPGLRDLDRFDAWIGRSLINECRDALRRRGRVREIGMRSIEAYETADRSPQPSSELRSAFARLSVDQRAILVLHHLQGFGVAEIGAWLGVPTGTVKWRLSRARRALRAALEREQ
jgi:RNA polymerase sigma-70 factor, ECF subfamily